MKVGIVPASLIAEKGCRLDADHYLNPTAKLERELGRKEKALASTQAAVTNLKAEIARRKGANLEAGVIPWPLESA